MSGGPKVTVPQETVSMCILIWKVGSVRRFGPLVQSGPVNIKTRVVQEKTRDVFELLPCRKAGGVEKERGGVHAYKQRKVGPKLKDGEHSICTSHASLDLGSTRLIRASQVPSRWCASGVG